MLITGSPLSQLDSPKDSPLPTFHHPRLTPNPTDVVGVRTEDKDTDYSPGITPAPGITPNTVDSTDHIQHHHHHHQIVNHHGNQRDDQRGSRTPTYQTQTAATLAVENVMALRNELERQKQSQSANRRHRGLSNNTSSTNSGSAKKRSFSQVDDYAALKFLTPSSKHNYTNSARSGDNSNRASQQMAKRGMKTSPSPVPPTLRMLNRMGSTSRTSSKMLLDKQQEKNWKTVDFLEKLMNLEERKIIANYAFAPSDGSMAEKIIDLKIFHPFFEVSVKFWTQNVEVNERTKNRVKDAFFNIFSVRITDSLRETVSELMAQNQINFIQTFSTYFQLLQRYLEKCKAAKQLEQQQIAGPLVRNAAANKQNMPRTMTPTMKHGQSHHHHQIQNVNSNPRQQNGRKKRALTHQRNSMSLGLQKSKSGRSVFDGGKPPRYQNEGQFFVREMIRIGNQHRSHGIDEKTLKLVAKCLIEVVEKQFTERFNEKTKRAFTIALKLGIKFMCVSPAKVRHRQRELSPSSRSTPRSNRNRGNSKSSQQQKIIKKRPPTLKSRSAQPWDTEHGGDYLD